MLHSYARNSAQASVIDLFGIMFGPSFIWRDKSHMAIGPKPFKSYADLCGLLDARGMATANRGRMERKLAQVGYYRLSGFWYPCRKFRIDAQGQKVLCNVTGAPLREDAFTDGTTFEHVFELYLFDKKLRIALLDAIERIEVQVRSVIAHEMGYHDPLAYQQSSFINPKQTQNFIRKDGTVGNIYSEWSARQKSQVDRSKEDYILWHRNNNIVMPFWVVIEAWDLGTISKYFEILKASHQNRICARLNIASPKVLVSWLKEINILRNRCAHHARVWNQRQSSPLVVPIGDPYFQKINLTSDGVNRIYGMIAVIWYLVRQIGPSSNWLLDVAEIVNKKPSPPDCTFASMGLPDEKGFQENLFI
ncbi:Abi family protein [Brucella pseudogrignonensis]